MSDLTLVLGNKAYSSWSMRPWLMLKHTGAAFREVVIPLRQPDTKAAILEHSPAGRVPVLHDGGVTIWDSLAIGEYLAERFPAAGLWPAASESRALARSISAEMHSGFTDLRANMPMNLKQKSPARDAPRRSMGISPGSPRSGTMPAPDSARTDRSCSAVSPSPTPCTRRSSPASTPMVSIWTRSAGPTPMPCSRCRPYGNGTQTRHGNPGKSRSDGRF
jgi:hypothetical protein